MGASLPAMARWIESTPSGLSWLGLFYGGNIAGAVFGCLLAGFYLLFGAALLRRMQNQLLWRERNTRWVQDWLKGVV